MPDDETTPEQGQTRSAMLLEDHEPDRRAVIYYLAKGVIDDHPFDPVALDVAATLGEAIRLCEDKHARRESYQVVIVDLRVPDSRDPEQTLYHLMPHAPGARFIIFSGLDDEDIAKIMAQAREKEGDVMWCPKDDPQELARLVVQSLEPEQTLYRSLAPRLPASSADHLIPSVEDVATSPTELAPSTPTTEPATPDAKRNSMLPPAPSNSDFVRMRDRLESIEEITGRFDAVEEAAAAALTKAAHAAAAADTTRDELADVMAAVIRTDAGQQEAAKALRGAPVKNKLGAFTGQQKARLIGAAVGAGIGMWELAQELQLLWKLMH